MTQERDDYPVEPVATNTLDPSTIRQLVDNQARELDLRTRELDIQQQQDRHNFEFAQASLNAQVEDRKDERVFQLQQRKHVYILIGVVSTLIMAAIMVAIWLGRDQVALEIVKSVVLLLGGGGAGYAVGRSKAQAQSSRDDNDP